MIKLIHYTPMTILLEALIKPYKNENADLTLAEKVIKVLKHESIAEHVNLSFDINEISRLCLQELVRHRIASYTVESTRFTLKAFLEMRDCPHYITEERTKHLQNFMIIPDTIKPEDIEEFAGDLTSLFFESFLFMNHWKNKGYGNDVLKYFLIESYKTSLVVTMNLRSFINFLNLRTDEHAHFEIRKLAVNMKNLVKNTYIEKLI